MSLTGAVIETNRVTATDIDRMFTLMQQYFTGVNATAFVNDLNAKPWVIVLRDSDTGVLQGFSTLCLMEATVQDESVRAFFSGDTIINRAYWGSLELERVWLRHLYTWIHADPETRWYWFLICKGYRTYRYLPVYFHRYYPSPEPTPPFEQAVLETFSDLTAAAHLYGERGFRVVSAETGPRWGRAEITYQRYEAKLVAEKRGGELSRVKGT